MTAEALVFSYPELALAVGMSVLSGVIAEDIPQNGLGIVHEKLTSKTGF